MQKNFLLLLSLFSFIITEAQQISGTVYDENGRQLPFASIVVEGSNAGTSANENGYYKFALNPGQYRISARHIGFGKETRVVDLQSSQVVNFTLKEQSLKLEDVTVSNNREDPAYQIIRNAIKAKPQNSVVKKPFVAGFYTKDQFRLRNMPNSFFGHKIEEEDRKEMGVDSAGKGILFLAENVGRIFWEPPKKVKTEILHSRVSGSNSYSMTFPLIIDFYQNNVMLARQLNPRGFVSPVADNALAYYKYKFLGTFYEDGKEINSIRVIPRRRQEPLFAGTINITEDGWKIHGTNLMVTKDYQLDLLDTAGIIQSFGDAGGGQWRVKNQVINLAGKFFGFDVVGIFHNVLNNYDVAPVFDKNTFGKVIMSYSKDVTKQDSHFWDSIRPVPLAVEEARDFVVKDSSRKAWADSVKKRSDYGKVKTHANIGNVFLRGGNVGKLRFSALIPNLEFNNAEGLVSNISFSYRSFKKGRESFTVEPVIRYGFGNGHLNAWSHFIYTSPDSSKSYRQVFTFSGGKRVTEFNKQSSISTLANTFSILLYGKNYIKTYENYYGLINYRRAYESGFRLTLNALYEDRKPLDNINDYAFKTSRRKNITPNYPYEKIPVQFTPHQALIFTTLISYQPGQRYIQFPYGKRSIGSSKPTFNLEYAKGIHAMGSDVDFDKWKFSVNHSMNFRLLGAFNYRLGAGGFLNKKLVPVQDYQHFNGNQMLPASQYLNSFQLAPYYLNSTTASFYGFGHAEHHFNGLLTNKIPLFNRLKWNLVAGANAFYVNRDNSHIEIFAGLENIFKIFRVDVVAAYENGAKGDVGVRIGAGGVIGNSVRFINQLGGKLKGNYTGY